MSPRYKKPRRCGCRVKGKVFKPSGVPLRELGKTALYIDELEALRLCDSRGLTQEEAGKKMGVSRGTVQRILSVARGKVAGAMSECKAIILKDVICKPKRRAKK